MAGARSHPQTREWTAGIGQDTWSWKGTCVDVIEIHTSEARVKEEKIGVALDYKLREAVHNGVFEGTDEVLLAANVLKNAIHRAPGVGHVVDQHGDAKEVTSCAQAAINRSWVT